MAQFNQIEVTIVKPETELNHEADDWTSLLQPQLVPFLFGKEEVKESEETEETRYDIRLNPDIRLKRTAKTNLRYHNANISAKVKKHQLGVVSKPKFYQKSRGTAEAQKQKKDTRTRCRSRADSRDRKGKHVFFSDGTPEPETYCSPELANYLEMKEKKREVEEDAYMREIIDKMRIDFICELLNESKPDLPFLRMVIFRMFPEWITNQ